MYSSVAFSLRRKSPVRIHAFAHDLAVLRRTPKETSLLTTPAARCTRGAGVEFERHDPRPEVPRSGLEAPSAQRLDQALGRLDHEFAGTGSRLKESGSRQVVCRTPADRVKNPADHCRPRVNSTALVERENRFAVA